MTEPVAFMQQMVGLEYDVRSSPVRRRFDERMVEGRITGHRCPSCGKVYVPPKGFCPLCVVETTAHDEVEVADRGTIASFTVVTPIQYRGQQEREPYVQASLLLDGADSTVGQQRVEGVPTEEVRMGMRVRAVWSPEEDRGGGDGGNRHGLGPAIRHWVPTGEPDAPREAYREHIL